MTGAGWAKDDGFIFDLFESNRVHTTELIASPLAKDNNTLLKEFSHIYLGILNDYDLMISKLFRGTSVDIEDCLILVKARIEEINIKHLIERYHETASFDISEEKVNKNLEYFLARLKKEGIKT